ncbi:MAG: hypothetical protein HFJ41_05950 [Clostridia bacterium]|nr:hypothetical protein [Clostridia bacterium]
MAYQWYAEQIKHSYAKVSLSTQTPWQVIMLAFRLEVLGHKTDEVRLE